jgi:NTP pyrophosphatase (non-canonical NTP hydrolase)
LASADEVSVGKPTEAEGTTIEPATTYLHDTKRRIAMKEDYNQFVQDCWMGDQDKKNLAIATLGLTGEAGEVAEKVKKHLRGDPLHNPTEHPDILLRNTEVAKELGDVLFYLTWVANYHGYTIEQVMAQNILKLTDRQRRNGTLRGDGDNR